VAVSQSLSPPSLPKPEQFQRSRKGAGTEVGTDLCDTHAARRITHSLAHNIRPPPGPAESRSAPFPGPRRHPDERQTHQYRRTAPTRRYLLRIGIMLSRWFPSRRGRAFWKRVEKRSSALKRSRSAPFKPSNRLVFCSAFADYIDR